MMKPLILITAPAIPDIPSPGPDLTGVRITYASAVAKAGGIPLILPLISSALALETAQHAHGILFSGGEDVLPTSYGKELQDQQVYSPLRDEVELALVGHATAHRMPVLGICRGHQICSVAHGAKMIQEVGEVSSEIVHEPSLEDKDAWTRLTHPIAVESDSLLQSILNEDIAPRVNSLHHQAVDESSLGPHSSVRVVAKAPDGIVEAIELRNYDGFFLGIQAHIEALIYGEQPAEPKWIRVFERFVKEAKTYASNPLPQ